MIREDFEIRANGRVYAFNFPIYPTFSDMSTAITNAIREVTGEHTYSETHRAYEAANDVHLGVVAFKGTKHEVSWIIHRGTGSE